MLLVYVKSNTLLGDAQHPSGVVLAEIVKANIPVRNGVVHLIHRPLMIIDTTVTQFLQVRKVSRFFPHNLTCYEEHFLLKKAVRHHLVLVCGLVKL